MASQEFTYTRLIELIPLYQERVNDTQLIDQLPTIITLAENRVATDMKQQGFKAVVSGTLPLDGVMAKPSWWKESIGFNFTDADGDRKPLLLRDYQYCRNYWPNSASTAEPRFYSDYNATNFLITPTPDAAYAFELAYYARLEPLDDSHQTNWMTLNAPQALLYACMIEANIFVKNTSGIAQWTALYNTAKGDLLAENQSRLSDTTQQVDRG